MRVCFVYDAIYPYVKGGAEKRIHELSTRLASNGYEVHVLGLKWWEGEDSFIKNGVHVHGVGEANLYNEEGRRSIKEALYFGYKVLPFLLKRDFDVIDCCGFPYFPCFSAKLASCKNRSSLIITWHEVWDDYWHEYLGKVGVFGRAVERVAARLPDRHIAVSEGTKRELVSIGAKEEDISVIPNGIDFDKIQQIPPADEQSDIIFVGRLSEHKNVDFLIRAIDILKKEIPEIRCKIIGDGPERERLETQAKDLGLEYRISFAGFLDDFEDVISHMKASKVFVLPSTREGFGIVALEANACGLPVITVEHRNNAAKDFVEDGVNGSVCKLQVEELSQRILMALNRDMRDKCLEKAKGHDWHKSFHLYSATLRKLLASAM